MGKSLLTKKYALFLKSDFEIAHFLTSFFLTKLAQKHKIIFLNKMKLGTNPKKLFLHPKSNFTICEKNLQQLRLFLKSCDSFLIFLIFRFSGVLPWCDIRVKNPNIPWKISWRRTERNAVLQSSVDGRCGSINLRIAI